jgi:2-succinyl-6-hydroxy-2,4-cyclohexadiene-1-carboxylate synthase
MSDIAASSIDWHVQWHGTPGSPALVLVHGFAGSLHTWNWLLPQLEEHFHVLLVDLPGHGKTPLPRERDFSLVRLGEALGQLISNAVEAPAFLCGYSMGGRIALHTALFDPEAIKGLALIGTSAGIADEAERELRRNSDMGLARNIREKGIEWFADYWGNLPIFSTQKNLEPPLREWLHQSRMNNDPEGLAYAQEHFGVGVQENLRTHLFELSCPLLLMAGDQDKKFCGLNWGIEQHAGGSIPVKRVEILGVGHAAHIEAPDLVAQELIDFFTNL